MPIKFRNDLTAKQVRELFNYDSESGNLIWRRRKELSSHEKRWNSKFADKFAGTRTSGKHGGYVQVRIFGVAYKAHRIIWLHQYGVWPEDELDHKKGKRTDNRIEKLREADRSEQQQNIIGRSHNTSGFTGVSFDRKAGKFMAQIGLNRKNHFLGYCDTAEEASTLYLNAKKLMHKFQPVQR